MIYQLVCDKDTELLKVTSKDDIHMVSERRDRANGLTDYPALNSFFYDGELPAYFSAEYDDDEGEFVIYQIHNPQEWVETQALNIERRAKEWRSALKDFQKKTYKVSGSFEIEIEAECEGDAIRILSEDYDISEFANAVLIK